MKRQVETGKAEKYPIRTFCNVNSGQKLGFHCNTSAGEEKVGTVIIQIWECTLQDFLIERLFASVLYGFNFDLIDKITDDVGTIITSLNARTQSVLLVGKSVSRIPSSKSTIRNLSRPSGVPDAFTAIFSAGEEM